MRLIFDFSGKFVGRFGQPFCLVIPEADLESSR